MGFGGHMTGVGEGLRGGVGWGSGVSLEEVLVGIMDLLLLVRIHRVVSCCRWVGYSEGERHVSVGSGPRCCECGVL